MGPVRYLGGSTSLELREIVEAKDVFVSYQQIDLLCPT